MPQNFKRSARVVCINCLPPTILYHKTSKHQNAATRKSIFDFQNLFGSHARRCHRQYHAIRKELYFLRIAGHDSAKMQRVRVHHYITMKMGVLGKGKVCHFHC